MNEIPQATPETKAELEACLSRLLKSEKPKIIAGSFKTETDFTPEQIKHFRSATYMWQLTTHDKEDAYKGMHLGVLLDENLNYVHMVFATFEMMNYSINLKYENNL
jgi:hypothetical protein